MVRIDGRSSDQIRKVEITRNYIKFPEGSCLIEMGNTKVICTASVEQSVPPFLKNTGNGWVTAEYGMLPRSCGSRIPRGKDSGRTFEIQRLVGRSLRTVVDMRAMGERTIWLDCDVIQGDGGTRTAAITGSFVALADAFNKLKRDGIIDSIPIKDFIAAISVGMLNADMLLDLCYEEDSKAGDFIEIQGTAERKPFNKAQMDIMLGLAQKGIRDLVAIQRDLLKGIL